MTPTELRAINRVIDTFEHPVRRRRLSVYTAIPAAVFLGAFLVSFLVGITNGIVDARRPTTIIPGRSMTAWAIFQNNVQVLLVILVGGTLTFTLGAFVLLLINAFHFGAGVGFLFRAYGGLTAIVAFAPHGVFEVAAFLVATSVSLRASVLLATWRVRGCIPDVKRNIVHELAVLIVLAFTFIALAAVVETTVTVAFVQWVR